MPIANKYSVLTTNRFQLADSDGSSGSEDEACQNIDPYAMVKQAEVEAVRLAKLAVKEAARAKPVILKEEAKVEKPVDAKKNNRREPRGNQQQRRGPRNERVQDNDNALSENNNQSARDGDDRRQRRPKTQDRRSGNPRTGVKATEKKGGHGAGNWGKATEKPGDFDETKPEEVTPETAENTENADPENAEPREPEEPEIVTISLEEYMASQAGETVEEKTVSSRKANNGEQLQGKVIRKNKIFMERKQVAAAVAPSSKVVVPNEQLAFVSGGNRRGNYRYNQDGNNNGDRDNRRSNQGGNRRNYDNNKQGGRSDRAEKSSGKPDFSKPSNDFPELGK